MSASSTGCCVVRWLPWVGSASVCGVGLALLAVCGLSGCEAPELPASQTASVAGNSQDTSAAAPEVPPETPAATEDVAATDVATPPGNEPAVTDAPPAEVPAQTDPATADQFAVAHEIFANSCQRCHSIEAGGDAGGPGMGPGGPGSGGPGPGGPGPGGPGGGPGRMRGPNLAHVGADPAHDASWIGEHIRDPKSHNPRSRMPAFNDRLSAEEIQQLAEFLASLK